MPVDRGSSPPMAAKDVGFFSKVSAPFRELRKRILGQANHDAPAEAIPAPPQVQPPNSEHKRQCVARNQTADNDTTMLHAMAVDAETHVQYVEPAMPSEPIRIRDAHVLDAIIRFKHMIFPNQTSDLVNTEETTKDAIASTKASPAGTAGASQEPSSVNGIEQATEHVENVSESTDTTRDQASLEPVDENKVPIVVEVIDVGLSSTLPTSPKPSKEKGADKIEPVAEADSIESTGLQNTPILTPSPSLVPSTITPSMPDQAIARLRDPQTVR